MLNRSHTSRTLKIRSGRPLSFMSSCPLQLNQLQLDKLGLVGGTGKKGVDLVPFQAWVA